MAVVPNEGHNYTKTYMALSRGIITIVLLCIVLVIAWAIVPRRNHPIATLARSEYESVSGKVDLKGVRQLVVELERARSHGVDPAVDSDRLWLARFPWKHGAQREFFLDFASAPSGDGFIEILSEVGLRIRGIIVSRTNAVLDGVSHLHRIEPGVFFIFHNN